MPATCRNGDQRTLYHTCPFAGRERTHPRVLVFGCGLDVLSDESSALSVGLLPGVVGRIGNRLLTVGSNVHRKLDRLAVLFLVVIGLGDDLPVLAAIEALDNAHVD